MIEIKIDKGQYLLNAAAGFQSQVFGASAKVTKRLCAETGGRELLKRRKRKVLKKIPKTDTMYVNYD